MRFVSFSYHEYLIEKQNITSDQGQQLLTASYRTDKETQDMLKPIRKAEFLLY